MAAKKGQIKLKPSIKNLIARRAIEKPDYPRDYLAKELKDEIEGFGEISPTEETLKKYISDARSSYTIDKPWNTAKLNEELIYPEAIPWLITLQNYMKVWLSKPFTQREAKWFNRLFGFKNSPLPPNLTTIDIGNSDINSIKCGVIATWAQVYAYREKIDSIAGIKDPDYSDLDGYLLKNDLLGFVNSELESSKQETKILSETTSPNKNHVNKFLNQTNLRISMILRSVEISYLGHTLGIPDLDVKNEAAHFGFLSGILTNKNVIDNLVGFNYPKRLKLLVALRKYFKDNPLTEQDTPENMEVKLLNDLNTIINNLKKDGEIK